MKAQVFAGAVLLCSCHGHKDRTEPVHNVDVPRDTVEPMKETDEMQAVRNDRIQFATMRPPGSSLPTLDRKVVLTGPPEAVALAERGDIALLDQLVGLLGDPERAWASEVMLAALTGREADIVNSFAGRPDEFFAEVGRTAKDRWRAWLDGMRGKLQWDAAQRQFVARA